jgi:hypothetical protein
MASVIVFLRIRSRARPRVEGSLLVPQSADRIDAAGSARRDEPGQRRCDGQAEDGDEQSQGIGEVDAEELALRGRVEDWRGAP